MRIRVIKAVAQPTVLSELRKVLDNNNKLIIKQTTIFYTAISIGFLYDSQLFKPPTVDSGKVQQDKRTGISNHVN